SRPKSNTDCLHVQASAGVTITDNTFQTETTVSVIKLNCGPGHGISIGSLGKDTNEVGEHNITLVSSVFFFRKYCPTHQGCPKQATQNQSN
ncbi:hypothetical protein HID58_010222, partial [Brassica napus]